MGATRGSHITHICSNFCSWKELPENLSTCLGRRAPPGLEPRRPSLGTRCNVSLRDKLCHQYFFFFFLFFLLLPHPPEINSLFLSHTVGIKTLWRKLIHLDFTEALGANVCHQAPTQPHLSFLTLANTLTDVVTQIIFPLESWGQLRKANNSWFLSQTSFHPYSAPGKATFKAKWNSTALGRSSIRSENYKLQKQGEHSTDTTFSQYSQESASGVVFPTDTN